MYASTSVDLSKILGGQTKILGGNVVKCIGVSQTLAARARADPPKSTPMCASLYVCMYACTCIYTRMYACMYACVCVYQRVCVCVCTKVCMNECMYVAYVRI